MQFKEKKLAKSFEESYLQLIPLNIKHFEPEHEFHGMSLCKEIRREVLIMYKVTVPNC